MCSARGCARRQSSVANWIRRQWQLRGAAVTPSAVGVNRISPRCMTGNWRADRARWPCRAACSSRHDSAAKSRGRSGRRWWFANAKTSKKTSTRRSSGGLRAVENWLSSWRSPIRSRWRWTPRRQACPSHSACERRKRGYQAKPFKLWVQSAVVTKRAFRAWR
jgi:hypothetical protein